MVSSAGILLFENKLTGEIRVLEIRVRCTSASASSMGRTTCCTHHHIPCPRKSEACFKRELSFKREVILVCEGLCESSSAAQCFLQEKTLLANDQRCFDLPPGKHHAQGHSSVRACSLVMKQGVHQKAQQPKGSGIVSERVDIDRALVIHARRSLKQPQSPVIQKFSNIHGLRTIGCVRMVLNRQASPRTC